MKQNQFIQSFMQNYMRNCQHYLTGEMSKFFIIQQTGVFTCFFLYIHILFFIVRRVFTCCLPALGTSSTNKVLAYIIDLQYTYKDLQLLTIIVKSFGTNLHFWCFNAHTLDSNTTSPAETSPVPYTMLKTTTCNFI